MVVGGVNRMCSSMVIALGRWNYVGPVKPPSHFGRVCSFWELTYYSECCSPIGHTVSNAFIDGEDALPLWRAFFFRLRQHGAAGVGWERADS